MEMKKKHEKQRLAILKRLKRGEVEEKSKTGEGGSKQLKLAMETEEERRTRLENDAAFLKSWQLCLLFKLDVLTT